MVFNYAQSKDHRERTLAFGTATDAAATRGTAGLRFLGEVEGLGFGFVGVSGFLQSLFFV